MYLIHTCVSESRKRYRIYIRKTRQWNSLILSSFSSLKQYYKIRYEFVIKEKRRNDFASGKVDCKIVLQGSTYAEVKIFYEATKFENDQIIT